MPGDDILGPDAQSLDHTITIDAPPSAVWPWLAQMGAGSRAGWYSYDFLDNGRQPSARRIHPEWQRLEVGMIFPAAPGATDGFELLAFDVERYLILGGREAGRLMVTWAFELEAVGNGATRLRVRARGAHGYRLFNVVPPALSRLLVRVVHGIMQRKQLREIARRAAADPLLDRFIPECEIREHHHIRVNAPAAVTLDAASKGEMFDTPLIRAIFKAREILLGTEPDTRERPKGLVAAMMSIGWGLLAEVPGREIVMGAVTKPWEANVVFRPIPPDRFAAFAEPGYVKIAWTLRADPIDETRSVFRTETRAVSTDPAARERFRRYWALVSPGIVAIRWLGLRPTRRAAERAARGAHAA